MAVNLQSLRREMKEIQQQKKFLELTNKILTDNSVTLENKVKSLGRYLKKSNSATKELAQEKTFSKTISKLSTIKKKTSAKKQRTIVLPSLVFALILGSVSSVGISDVLSANQITGNDSLTSGYVIQNLKGDTVDTWVSWNLVDEKTLHVNIINGDKYPKQAEIIRNTILSTESIELDDFLQHKGPKGSYSTYFMGWNGALDYASTIKDTKLFIPTNLQVIESNLGQGDITIELSNMRSGDGYSGYTKSITDANNNQILKSHIVIYEIESLSNSQIETISRHEMGHALGLAHSSAPEDLMAPLIITEYPYISECDIEAIVSLYDGGEKSHVVCEK